VPPGNRSGRRPLAGLAHPPGWVDRAPVNALPQAGIRFYDGRAAASYILGIRKEVLAMFANRQTPPGVAL
jgi:hypothetical protein